MMVKSIAKRKTSLVRLVEERSLAKKKHQQVPYIPKDCISNILVLLPFDSLQRSRFVCKHWYNIIKNPKFVDDHLHRSESVLIFLSPIPIESLYPFSTPPIRQEKPNTVSVESILLQQNSIFNFNQPAIDSTKFYVQFLKFSNGKSEIGEYNLNCFGNIRAACNGLILLDNKLKKGGLIVMNPVTRELFAPPVGTLCRPHNESYGIALNDATGEYKVVHLFRDQLGFVNCEILSLWTKRWREIDGPAKWREVRHNAFGTGSLGYGPVSAIGALHWIPQIDRIDYIVSMEVENEKFHQIPLPKSGRHRDGIVEMGGFLSFVIHDHEDVNRIDIWTLKGLCGEVWTKNHSITVASIKGMVPLFSLRIKGDIIFRRVKDDSFYVYDFQFQEMSKVKMVKGCIPGPSAAYLPHVNSFVSWMDARQNMFD